MVWALKLFGNCDAHLYFLCSSSCL